MPDRITLTAPAKINLHLHILGKAGNGYHLLDSLVAFTAFGDTITIDPADKFSLTVVGPFANELGHEDPANNLIAKSISLLSEQTGQPYPYKITLEKNIPIGGGLGGGSSDAATILKKISEICGIQADLPSITSALGSDITACLHAPNPVIMRGTGNEIVTAAPALPRCPLLLVNTRKHCATPTVYKNLSMTNFSKPVIWPLSFKALPPGGGIHLSALPPGGGGLGGGDSSTELENFSNFLKDNTRNDLTAPAIKTEPIIADILNEIGKQRNCLLSRLSGSGATAFGIFPTKEDVATAAAQIKTTHPHWWVVETTTL